MSVPKMVTAINSSKEVKPRDSGEGAVSMYRFPSSEQFFPLFLRTAVPNCLLWSLCPAG